MSRLVNLLELILPEEARLTLLREHLLIAPELTDPLEGAQKLGVLCRLPGAKAANTSAMHWRSPSCTAWQGKIARRANCFAKCMLSASSVGWRDASCLVLEAQSRLPDGEDGMGVEDADLVSQFGDYPMLVFVARVVGAERALAQGRLDLCRHYLAEATNYQPQFSFLTRWIPRVYLTQAAPESAKGAAEARLRSACRPNNITSASARRRSFFGSELRTNSAKPRAACRSAFQSPPRSPSARARRFTSSRLRLCEVLPPSFRPFGAWRGGGVK